MNTKFSTVIHTLTFASLGASVVATKFFSDYSNSLATPLVITTVALGIASVITLIGELRKADAREQERDLDTRFDDVWQAMRDLRRDLENQMCEDRRICHSRLDQEVEAIHNRFAVRACAAQVADKYSTRKKKVSL